MRHWKPITIEGHPTVGIVVATYNQTHSLQALIASLQNQTYDRFKCLVYHDGPVPDAVAPFFKSDDARFDFFPTPVREKKFGHNLRARGFAQFFMGQQRADYLCTTNGDNYYAPVFLEALVGKLQEGFDIAYCDMVLSHKRNGRCYQPLTTKPERGSIDVGCWMAKSELVNATPWRDPSFSGDWTYLSDLMKKTTPERIGKVPMALFFHN